jgi:ERF superfamily protein
MTKKKSGAKVQTDNDSKIQTELQVIKSEPEAVQTPTSLIALAIEKGSTIDAIERLMNLEERWRAAGAKREFFSALSKFQKECPPIIKVRSASFGERGAKYNYAALGDIEEKIKEAMFNNGLSKRWEITDIKEENGKQKISVKCIVSHVDGHSETTVMEGSLDNSGSKNEIQQRGSTITYLRRYTLVGALGISTDDIDNDNRDNKQGKPGKTVEEKTSNKLLDGFKKEVDETKTSVEIKQTAPSWIEKAGKTGMTEQHVEELKAYINEQFLIRKNANTQKNEEGKQ